MDTNLEGLVFNGEEVSNSFSGKKTRTCSRLIAVEGIDGSGKSTLVRHLSDSLSSRLKVYSSALTCSDFEVKAFSAWEANGWTKTLRQILVSGGVTDVRCEAMIAFAARRALILEKIQPHLDSGGFAIVDRYVATSYAYQCNDHADFKFVTDLTIGSCAGLLPGLTLYLDVGAQTAIDRLSKRNDVDGIESRGLNFFVDLKEKFKTAFHIFDSTTDGITVSLNANQPEESVLRAADAIIAMYLDILLLCDQNERSAAISELDRWRLFKGL